MNNLLHAFLVRAVSGAVFGCAVLGTFLLLPKGWFFLLLVVFLLEILVVEWPRLCRQPGMLWGWLLTPLYPVAPMILLMGISLGDYRWIVLVMIVLAWIHDTCAYVVGNVFGKHKLWAEISPHKTWEGALGGLLGTLLSVWFINSLVFYPFSCALICVISVLISGLFVLGDLFESWLKRMAGLKDSGSIMPGHGGLLDRFDGILLATYALALWLFFR